MNTKLYCSLVSLACLLYARYLNKKSTDDLTYEQLKERNNDVMFFTVFGITALLMSYY